MRTMTETLKKESATAETFTLNGKLRPLSGETVEDAVALAGIDPKMRGVAVAVNAQVLPRAQWTQTKIKAGDRVDVVRPLAGG